MKIILDMPESYTDILIRASMRRGLVNIEDLMYLIILESPDIYQAWLEMGTHWTELLVIHISEERRQWPEKFPKVPLKIKWKDRSQERKLPPVQWPWQKIEDDHPKEPDNAEKIE